MSIRSLITTGLLASAAFAAPGKRDDNTTTVTKTVTSTKTKTTTSKITKTTTEKVTKTTTEKITKTSTETDTVTATITAAPVTVTRTASATASTVTVAGAASTVTVAKAASTVTVGGATSTATIYTVAAPAATVTSTVTVTLSPTAASAASTSASSKATSSSSSSSSSVVAGATTTAATTGTATTATTVNTSGTTTIIATATSTATGLADAAKAAGLLFFGTAADIPGTGEAQDYYYMTEFNNTHDFNEVTPANTMKFFATEPQQGVFDYSGANTFLSIVQPTKQYIRCHNLIWKSQLSSWVTNPTTPWNATGLSAVLYNHAYTLVSHFGDTCYSWDVVNEAFTDANPAAYDNTSIWNQVIGPSYVLLAFQAATQAVKDHNLKVKLVYNDYNIESPNAKTNATLALVSQIKAAGYQIDHVGFESHFIVGSSPSKAQIVQNIQSFAALGVDVVITELDVRTVTPPSAAIQTQQVQDYYNTVSACVTAKGTSTTKGCLGVVVWDFDDTYSWIPQTFKGQGYGDLFLQPGGANTTLVKKAAYDGVLQALNGQPEAL